MIIDAVADLHGHYPELEGGDLLIVAGDLTARHTDEEFLQFCEWLDKQKYSDIVVVAGNHDTMIENKDTETIVNTLKPYKYLCDSGTEFGIWEQGETHLDLVHKKLKIWGSPWTLAFPGINPHCTAFTGDEELLAEKFALIPDDIDILVTHGPPFGILDEVERYPAGRYNSPITEEVGSESLLKRVFEIRPTLNIFGHIHEGYGQYDHVPREGASESLGITQIKFINCSHVNEHYQPVNKPVRIVL